MTNELYLQEKLLSIKQSINALESDKNAAMDTLSLAFSKYLLTAQKTSEAKAYVDIMEAKVDSPEYSIGDIRRITGNILELKNQIKTTDKANFSNVIDITLRLGYYIGMRSALMDKYGLHSEF